MGKDESFPIRYKVLAIGLEPPRAVRGNPMYVSTDSTRHSSLIGITARSFPAVFFGQVSKWASCLGARFPRGGCQRQPL